MRSHRMAGAWRSLAVVVGSLTVASLNGAESSSKANLSQTQRIELGREAFVMNFARPSSQVGDGELGKRGNGLGPLLNDTSCVNCHNLGGVGGAGGLDSNVIMVGIVTRPNP